MLKYSYEVAMRRLLCGCRDFVVGMLFFGVPIVFFWWCAFEATGEQWERMTHSDSAIFGNN